MRLDPDNVIHGKPDRPILSAIIISCNDEETIERTVGSVVNQQVEEPWEVIVVNSGTDRTSQIVADKFPSIQLIVLEELALPGKARNAGLAVATGDYVSFPGSHVEIPAGSLLARITAHRKGFPMVTGSLLNGTRTPAGWASYFMDHSDSLPGRPSEELSSAPAHCSYNREVLLRSGLFPEDMRAGEDTIVNVRLWAEGHRAWRDKDILLYHRSPCRTPWLLIKHHFIRGRAWGRILCERGDGFASLSGYGTRRMARTVANVRRWGHEFEYEYEAVKPLVRLGIFSAWAGMAFEAALWTLRTK